MIRQITLLCCLLVGLLSLAAAQDLAPLEMQLEGLELNGSGGAAGVLPAGQLALELMGGTNEALIQQVPVGSGFPANVAAVLQSGLFNSAILEQLGLGNAATVLQDGENNLYKLVVAGNNNRTSVVQEGSDNVLTQELSGDNLQFLVLQQGSNNELHQIDTGGIPRDYTVSQVGNGIKLTIVNGMLPAGGGAIVAGTAK